MTWSSAREWFYYPVHNSQVHLRDLFEVFAQNRDRRKGSVSISCQSYTNRLFLSFLELRKRWMLQWLPDFCEIRYLLQSSRFRFAVRISWELATLWISWSDTNFGLSSVFIKNMFIVRLSAYACCLKNITVFLRRSATLAMTTVAISHSILAVCAQLSTAVLCFWGVSSLLRF